MISALFWLFGSHLNAFRRSDFGSIMFTEHCSPLILRLNSVWISGSWTLCRQRLADAFSWNNWNFQSKSNGCIPRRSSCISSIRGKFQGEMASFSCCNAPQCSTMLFHIALSVGVFFSGKRIGNDLDSKLFAYGARKPYFGRSYYSRGRSSPL